MKEKLSGLAPEKVFSYFEELCAIPHGSGNTKQISDYLVDFAAKHGIRCTQDIYNNVILFADGTPGYEHHPAVILQGHMDMVCEKDADCPIDMQTQGLDVTHDGTFVFANGTTLGGDDGIAVAYCMAILTDPQIAHPPLEIVITVDEEIGMLGADAIDLSCLKGRTLINIDSEEEGILTLACAGGALCDIRMQAERRAVYGPCVRLTVEGLRGGHSGTDISKNRANANTVMGQFLSRVRELMPLCLTKLCGGAKDNVIPRSCEATLVAMGTDIDRINGVAEKLQEEIRKNFDEPDAIVRGDDVDALGGNALTTQCTDRVIALLCAAPNGVIKWSKDIPGQVQTSLNLGVLELDEALRLTFCVRSSVEEEKRALLKRLSELADFHGAEASVSGVYPAWEYRKDSPLREMMTDAYRSLTGKEPKIESIHAGLECGVLGQKLPGLDSVSFGPDIHDIHTSRERLNIASVQRTYALLCEVLKRL